ncbi:pectate lyase family protein [Sphingopyxis sp.]|uniref:pectate lyase family protein n=1 Tax=Sphingopyxis sp. TaxID=1908224 RepID=UPI003D0FE841
MPPQLRTHRTPCLGISFSLALMLASCAASGGQAEEVDPQLVSGKAFPTAIGYGVNAAGGRGGKMIQVTTLDDAGAGSLRSCLEATGPRTCIFRIGGVFRFSGKPPVIKNPYLTIAGQTASGGGVTIAHDGSPQSRTPLLIKNSHDIIVRHIRVRNDRIGGERESEDSITIENSRNVIIDHVSASWARDEIINGYGDNDLITISHSIFAYGIPKHDKCALLGSDPKNIQNMSFIGNICAHNGDRNPDINFRPSSCIEVLNNIFFNAQSEFAEIWESYGGTPVSIVGNIFKAGPNSSARSVGVIRQTEGSAGPSSIYLDDNRFIGDFIHVDASVAGVRQAKPSCPLTVEPSPASEAFGTILANAGAWPRDAIDLRVISDVRNGTGKIVSKPGEIPPVADGKPYTDSDADGMDDLWESRNGMKVGKFDPWDDANGDDVSNFDAFLDYLDRNFSR